MIADEYARHYGIPPRQPGESDKEFRSRVAGKLRARGKIIEAHEAYTDAPYDSNPSAMLGILGGVAEEMQGNHAPDPERQIGDDMAAGIVSQQERPSMETLLLAILLQGK